MKPITVYLSDEIVDTFKKMKKFKKIKSLSGEIRKLVMANYDPLQTTFKNQKPITDYFKG